jgi:hypothetical protein
MSDPENGVGGGVPLPPAIPPPTADGRVPEPRPAEKRSIPPNIQQMVASKRLQQAQAQG